MGKCSKYIVKNIGDIFVEFYENLLFVLEDLDLYEDLLLNRLSDDDDSFDEKEKEIFI